MSVANDDWSDLRAFLPAGWVGLAHETGATKGLRKDKSPEFLLRTLLIHFACGYSLRETVVRARAAGLGDMTDVALLKRLRKSEAWLHAMCVKLFEERGVRLDAPAAQTFRLLDATTVKEPGKTGSLWRIHFSVSAPSLRCDYFKLTATKGEGSGESFSHFPVAVGDRLLADSGYSRAPGLRHVASGGGHFCVRVNPKSLPLFDGDGSAFDLAAKLRPIRRGGQVKEWAVSAGRADGSEPIPGRLCVVRKLEKDIVSARKRKLRMASKKCVKLAPNTLLYAEYVILFTTFPAERFTTTEVLDAYRLRWQIELVFKRLKQIASLGHLPKRDDASARAWLYGKLLVALLTEKIIAHAGAISPWRSEGADETEEPVDRVQFHASSGETGDGTSDDSSQDGLDLG